MIDFSTVRAFLFDLDGVFFVGKEPIRGGREAIEFLHARNIPCRFTTNTTTRSLDTMYGELVEMGLPIEKSEVFTAPQAAVRFLRQQGSPPIHLVLNENTSRDFAEFPREEHYPKYIVIGDVGDRWDYPLMNRLFGLIMDGATILALHKGRYWQVRDGLRMDIGAFIAGLEYVTSKPALVVGKPSRSFFELALGDLGCPPDQVVMVGDDLYNDIEGAQQAGMRAVLVRTGKFRESVTEGSSVKPDLIIDSIADLPGMLTW
ncbi:MAG: TIGR01458 family HAD-type hydrolase [bacterium]|nr:TIGR01458 family HAD-type hydrolase [bacterium]